MPGKIGKTILLIEDDPDQVFLYSTKFKLEGLKIISATNGVEGVKKVEAEKPDLILLDIVMDEMDGMEVLEKLKGDKNTKNIPVVLLTNLIKKDLMEKSKRLGAVGFWSKAEVLPTEIVSRVKLILNIK